MAIDGSIISNLENQCKALPPGVEVEIQKKVTKKELEELMKKVGCEVDIHKGTVYILKPNKCLKQAETYGLSAEDVRQDCDIIDIKHYKLLLKLKKEADGYLKAIKNGEKEVEYYTNSYKKTVDTLKKTKEDLVKVKKDMDTFKGTSYYRKVYKQYVNLMNNIKKAKKQLIDFKNSIDKREKLNQKNLGYYNALMKKAKKYIDKFNKYHTE